MHTCNNLSPRMPKVGRQIQEPLFAATPLDVYTRPNHPNTFSLLALLCSMVRDAQDRQGEISGSHSLGMVAQLHSKMVAAVHVRPPQLLHLGL